MNSPDSLWRQSAPPAPSRPQLTGDLDVDVAIVGGGFTGLWTAHSLIRADPSLRIVLLEAQEVGFGASGRNGGWCSALFPTSWERLQKAGGVRGAQAMHEAMVATVAEVGRVVRDEALDADWSMGGTVVVARSAPQLARAREEVRTSQERGLHGLSLLTAAEAREHLSATDVIGGTYTPHCAAVHPLKLARSLAARVESLGVSIYERSAVDSIEPGFAQLSGARVRAPHIVRATEGWTRDFRRREIAPVYSLMVATEPLTDEQWTQVGLAGRQTFSDGRHVIIYGQRTADGRMVFGGRGAPYHFKSRIRPDFDADEQVFAKLRATLREMFPILGDVAFTHAWGGPLGIARDWSASVGLRRTRQGAVGWAGGYVGDGVSTTNLAGRTLSELILERDSEITALPWVNHRSRLWEPEPLRWLGINAGLQAMTLADAEEQRTHQGSRIAKLMAPLMHG